VLTRGPELAARLAAKLAEAGVEVTPRGDSTLVSWRAADADGDALRASIDYSADGGRTWRAVASDLGGRSVRLPARALSASRTARLRVRINDGFDTTIAVSGTFRARGAAPRVRIVTRGQSMGADAVLLLEGSAFDDAGRPLTGRRLRWFAGRRLLGTGERLAAQGLPASTRAIRLVATDATGRSAQTQVRIRVTPVKPQFLVFEAPPSVDRRARRLGQRVAATVPAELRIAGRRFRLSRSARRITLPIRAGRSTLQQRYSLIAGRRSATGALSIPRK
jgi:hypothetical protein